MARKPRETFSLVEVEITAVTAALAMLKMAHTALIESGAKPSPEVGVCIMHFAQGAKLMQNQLKGLCTESTIEESKSDRLKEIIENVLDK